MTRQAKGWGGSSVADLRERWKRKSVYVYGAIASTNEVAREWAEKDAPSGTVVLAKTQTAGRGRGEHTWISPEQAGVYMSVLFRPERRTVAPLVTILAGIDVARSLNGTLGSTEVSIKWPNDLMARDRKLGGILAEASQGPDGGGTLILGVGVNVHAKRLPAALTGAVALDELSEKIDLVEAADAMLRGLERRLHSPPDALDEAALEELDGLDWLRNRQVRHEIGSAEPVEGIAAGIAPDGALLLRPARGALRRVVAGSIRSMNA